MTVMELKGDFLSHLGHTIETKKIIKTCCKLVSMIYKNHLSLLYQLLLQFASRDVYTVHIKLPGYMIY